MRPAARRGGFLRIGRFGKENHLQGKVARSAPLAPAGERLRNPEAGPKASYKGLQHTYGVGFFDVSFPGSKSYLGNPPGRKKVRDAARPMVSPDFQSAGWKLGLY